MLTYLDTDIFDSPAQTLVNTVNTVGVMGKGIAKSYKEKYPAMFHEYKELCDDGQFTVGKLQLWRGSKKWVLNFPTKTTWKQPSKIEYIKLGLEKFVNTYEQFKIRSISFPLLGCGNGNLDWKDVKPIMEYYLGRLPIDIYIHEVQVNEKFVPEHKDNFSHIPYNVEMFLDDIRKIIFEHKGIFYPINSEAPFNILNYSDDLIEIRRGQKIDRIPDPKEIFIRAWSKLQHGLYTKDFFTDDTSQRYKSYIFAILKELPYTQVAKYSRPNGNSAFWADALLLKQNAHDVELPIYDANSTRQLALWE